jgi:murein DD-endopeptidase MepM/ murein hydrolase activator NlpD
MAPEVNRRRAWLSWLSFAVLVLAACAHTTPNPYESSAPEERTQFKQVVLPFPKGTQFKISQGAFGKYTHNDPGHEYTWDFDVPYGTPVISVEDGTVIQVWQPNQGGDCDRTFNDSAHNIKVRHADGTVAQYVHVDSRVKVGDRVKQGTQIAVTAKNGFICMPQLDFGIYQDEHHLYGSGQMRTIPLRFEGLPDGGMAHEGYRGGVP